VAALVLPRLLGGGALIYAVMVGAGLLLTRVLDHSWLLTGDRDLSRWFAAHRTSTLNSWTLVGSRLSTTLTAIVVTALLVIGLRLWLHRWRESVAIFLSIQGELILFLLVSSTVHRHRPMVRHLDPAPPTSSFPSGHTGAAVALYVGLAVVLVVLSREWSSRAAAFAAAGVLALIPVIVGLSRLYRGMHFLTDVVAGAVTGGLWMALVMSTVLSAPIIRRQPSRR
jgi:undecaprenyl-diphosphatase